MGKRWTKLSQKNVDHYNKHPERHEAILAAYAGSAYAGAQGIRGYKRGKFVAKGMGLSDASARRVGTRTAARSVGGVALAGYGIYRVHRHFEQSRKQHTQRKLR